jgi:hypothetical protein
MSATPFPYPLIAAIKADPGPIPDLKPPKKELGAELPEQAILGAVVCLAFAVLLLGRVFHKPKVIAPVPPEHPAAAVRRVLAEMGPNSSPAAAAAELAHAFRNYLRVAYGLGEEELTTLELSDRFGAHRLSGDGTAEAVGQFLRECNVLQFAPPGDTPLEPLTTRAFSLLDELERQRSSPAVMPPPLPAAT